MMSRAIPIAAFLALALFVSAIDCEEKLKRKDKRGKDVDKQQALKRFLLVARICEADEFQCSYGNCIPIGEVCDTHTSCFNGDDEENCPTDCTGQNQFKCENSDKCIGIVDKCDGHADCTDYSDEAFCGNFDCPAGRFRCVSSNVCIYYSYVCDKQFDCEDGSDERNCYNNSCSSSQWQCTDKERCIPQTSVCDGYKNCLDNSDETSCQCTDTQFHCSDGMCIPSKYKCDGIDDCGDKSDEITCPALPSNVCADVMKYEDCFHMNETTHPICLIYADGDKFCRKFCGFCH